MLDFLGEPTEQDIKDNIGCTINEMYCLLDKLKSTEKTIDKLDISKKISNCGQYIAGYHYQLIALETDRVARELAENYKGGDITC